MYHSMVFQANDTVTTVTELWLNNSRLPESTNALHVCFKNFDFVQLLCVISTGGKHHIIFTVYIL